MFDFEEPARVPIWKQPGWSTTAVRQYAKDRGWTEHRDELEGLLPKLLKEPVKVYVVLSSEVSGGVHPLLSGGASLNFPKIEAVQRAIAPRVTKPGWVAIVNDSRYGNYPTFDILDLTTVAVHELAHFTDWGVLPDVEPMAPEVGQRLLQQLAISPHEWPEVKQGPRYGLHDLRFTRGMLHLAYRAKLAGYAVNFPDLMAWKTFGYRNPADYQAALAEELTEQLHEPILKVLATNPPKPFFELFQSDQRFADWLDRQAEARTPPAIAASA